ncbi:MAG: hypothetical protein HY023_03605 [Chloroflexi bacterium]|nr:hypothetical protein [Chloroflexota bacterium]MBI3761975.1 hypothetical protein [Chloroflexota bacterium]
MASDALVDANEAAHPPDLLIEPAVGHIGLFDADRADEAYRLGATAARAATAELGALREWHDRAWRVSLRERLELWLKTRLTL